MSSSDTSVGDNLPDLLHQLMSQALSINPTIWVICVTGVRHRVRGILSNYIHKYLTWIDDHGHDPILGQHFLTESDTGTSGIIVWPELFTVKMESQPVTMPVLLIDWCDPELDPETSDMTCVHMFTCPVKPVDEFKGLMQQRMLECNHLLIPGSEPGSRSLLLIRDMEFRSFQTWKTSVTRYMSKEVFRVPNEAVCEFLMSLTYHMFGNICKTDHSPSLLLHRLIQDLTSDSDPDSAVTEVVDDYKIQMRQKLSQTSSGRTNLSKQEIASIHNDLVTTAIYRIKSMRSPAQVTLSRIQMVNQMIRKEYNVISQQCMSLRQERCEFLCLTLTHQYMSRMLAAVTQRPSMDDQQLMHLHHQEMSKCISVIDDNFLRTTIEEKFQDIVLMNTLARSEAESVTDGIITDHIKQFEDQLRDMLSQSLDVSRDQVDKQYANVRGIMLHKFDAAVKSLNLPAATVRQVKKKFNDEMDGAKSSILMVRRDELRQLNLRMESTIKQFVKEMTQEFRHDPFMSKEKSCVLNSLIRDKYIAQWTDKGSANILRRKLTDEVTELWKRLQAGLVQTRSELVQRYVKGYTSALAAKSESPYHRPVSLQEFRTESNRIKDTLMKEFISNPAVVTCKNLREKLEEQIEKSFDDLKETYKEENERRIQDLIERSRYAYINDIGWENVPQTVDDLQAIHKKVMDRVFKRLKANSLVKNSHKMMEYEKQLAVLIQHAYELKEQELQQRLHKQLQKLEKDTLADDDDSVVEAKEVKSENEDELSEMSASPRPLTVAASTGIAGLINYGFTKAADMLSNWTGPSVSGSKPEDKKSTSTRKRVRKDFFTTAASSCHLSDPALDDEEHKDGEKGSSSDLQGKRTSPRTRQATPFKRFKD